MTVGAYYFDGQWFDENPRIVGPMTHAFWMASVAFDGARSIHGLVPDLDLHCQRLVRSAEAMGLRPAMAAPEIEALCREAVQRLPRDLDLYIRPAFFAEEGFVNPDAGSTRFVLAVYEEPMPTFRGFTACRSTLRRPAEDMATTDAKTSGLYPNSARALREADGRGFDNAVIDDPNGNVAEFATANLWIVKDGVAQTPAGNGTFLAGITRARVTQLLAESGTGAEERVLRFADVMEADEIFSTGNYTKVSPVVRIEDRHLQPGPVARKAYDLYMDWAKGFSAF